MKAARYIAHHSHLIIILALLLVVPAFIGIKNTKINYDLLNYLPQNLDSMRGEKILDKEFGEASNAMLIVENKTTRELLDLKASLASIDGVSAVVGIDDILDPSIPREVLPDAIRKTVYSEKGTLLIIQYAESAVSKRTEAATVAIRGRIGPGCYLSCTTATNIDTQNLSSRESPLYILLAVGFITIILGLGMESWLIPVIFLIEIGLAILYNMGTNIVFGKISYLTQALAAVLQLGVTMDFSIFLLHRYDEERRCYEDRREAMASAIQKTFVTISGGALTEIAGFLSLCVMDLTIGADIGVVMAKGVVIGLLGTMTVLPSLILMLDGPIHKLSHKPLMPSFEKTSGFVTKHAGLLSLVFVLLFIPAIYGRIHTQQDYDLNGSIPASLPSVVAATKLKTDFNMMTSHFILVRDDLPPAAIRDMIKDLEATPGVSGVLAVEKYVGALIPEEFLPENVRGIFKHGGREMLIVNSPYKVSTPEESEQLAKIISIVKTYDGRGLVTGEAALSKDLVDIAANDFKRVDFVSIGAILIIILIIFTSFSLPVVLVGSIELAILMNLGLPFFIGEKISFLSTIVIGCIQLGVTIDYAILLVSRFKEQLRGGLETHAAMKVAFQASAPSIITSGLTLFSATAGVAIVSQMSLLKSICSMIARGSIISVLVILFLLPALLIESEKLISKTSLNWRRPFRNARLAQKEPSK